MFKVLQRIATVAMFIPVVAVAGSSEYVERYCVGNSPIIRVGVDKRPLNDDMDTAVISVQGKEYRVPHYNRSLFEPRATVAPGYPKDARSYRVLVTVGTPGGCKQQLLLFDGQSFSELLDFTHLGQCYHIDMSSGPSVRVRQRGARLWPTVVTYRADESGLHYQEEKREWYLEATMAGGTLRPIVLEGAGCRSRTIPKGTYVTITEYDSGKNQYRAETLTGDCGWLLPELVEDATRPLITGLSELITDGEY